MACQAAAGGRRPSKRAAWRASPAVRIPKLNFGDHLTMSAACAPARMHRRRAAIRARFMMDADGLRQTGAMRCGVSGAHAVPRRPAARCRQAKGQPAALPPRHRFMGTRCIDQSVHARRPEQPAQCRPHSAPRRRPSLISRRSAVVGACQSDGSA